MPKNKTKQNYYDQAEEWRDQIYYNTQLRLRWSFLLNIALFILLLLISSTLIMLFPLKQTVPFVISHNQTTGEITQLGNLKSADFSHDWTLARYFIIRYIVNRESFHFDNINRPYQIAYAMSDKAIATVYEKEANSNNPKAPYNIYGKNKYATVHINSIARLNENTAEVHFDKTIHDKMSGHKIKIALVTILKWRYSEMPATQRTLDRNPLGFQVTYYQPTHVTLEMR